MTIKLNHTDSGQTIDLDVEDCCKTVTPQVFCRSSKMLVIDCGNCLWNPLEYVKINGEWGLLVGKRNAAQADSWNWWYSRDPSRNGEYSFWYSWDRTDSNKIFLYWDDLDNLPEVEYAQKSDAGVAAKGVENATLNIHATHCGIGLHLYNCRGNQINVDAEHCGRGVYAHTSPDNEYGTVVTNHIGHVPVHFTHGSSRNKVWRHMFDNVGICESRSAHYYSADSNDNQTIQLVGKRARFGRFWRMDGGVVFFEAGVTGNTINQLYAEDCFMVVEDGSGMPGNSVWSLLAVNCENVIDQADVARHGKGDPVEKIIRSGVLVNSGHFGVRVPPMNHLAIIGKPLQPKSRDEYPFYPDLPEYESWNFQRDAVNPQGEYKQRFVPVGD